MQRLYCRCAAILLVFLSACAPRYLAWDPAPHTDPADIAAAFAAEQGYAERLFRPLLTSTRSNLNRLQSKRRIPAGRSSERDSPLLLVERPGRRLPDIIWRSSGRRAAFEPSLLINSESARLESLRLPPSGCKLAALFSGLYSGGKEEGALLVHDFCAARSAEVRSKSPRIFDAAWLSPSELLLLTGAGELPDRVEIATDDGAWRGIPLELAAPEATYLTLRAGGEPGTVQVAAANGVENRLFSVSAVPKTMAVLTADGINHGREYLALGDGLLKALIIEDGSNGTTIELRTPRCKAEPPAIIRRPDGVGGAIVTGDKLQLIARNPVRASLLTVVMQGCLATIIREQPLDPACAYRFLPDLGGEARIAAACPGEFEDFVSEGSAARAAAYHSQRIALPSFPEIILNITFPQGSAAPFATILEAHGAYRESPGPALSPFRAALLERGIALAYLALPGGAEGGRAWHVQGVRDQRSKSLAAIIEAVTLLRERRIAPGPVLLRGRSGGAPLLLAAARHSPSCFAGVSLDRPFLELRKALYSSEPELAARERIEWGSPEIKHEFSTLTALDPFPAGDGAVPHYPPIFARGALQDNVTPVSGLIRWAAAARRTAGNRLVLYLTRSGDHSGEFEQQDEELALATELAWYEALLKQQ